MPIRKERVAFVVLLMVLAIGMLVVVGCQEAEESTTTASSGTDTTGTETSSTDTTVPGETTTTGGAGETTTTEGGGEAVAPVSDEFKICTDCHSNFNQFLEDSKVLNKNFSHGLHLNKGYKCEDCHAVPTHQPDKIVVPPMLSCFACHSQEENAIAPGECSACHPADFPLVPANHNAAGWLPVAQTAPVKTVSAKHSDLALQDPAYCAMCHAQSFCLGCHKTPMPHAGDWQASHPQTVQSQGKAGCEQCHPDEYLCNDCHHPGYKPATEPWRLQHPPFVKSGGAEPCFGCHNPLTCAHCHITGELNMDLAPTG